MSVPEGRNPMFLRAAALLSAALLCVLLYGQVVVSKNHKVMIFGGDKHDVYLGCLSCNASAHDSVLNTYGPHGSKYGNESIWNHYSEYGSKYSDYGVCNKYANEPPVIVDEQGNSYGRLTMNKYHSEIGGGRNLVAWLEEEVCE